MKRPIFAYGHPKYRQKIRAVSPADAEQIAVLLRDMRETMWFLKSEALAAIQLGVPYNLFLVEIPQEGKKVFLNSKILAQFGAVSAQMETDVSIPDLAVGIDRFSEIEVRYEDENFEAQTGFWGGKAARNIIQMTDLVRGISMIDRLHPLRRRALRSYLQEVSSGKVQTTYRLLHSI